MSSYTPKIDPKVASMRAAGVTQAVIASGAPVEQWVSRTLYGLLVARYAAERLKGNKVNRPVPPASIRSKTDGNE